ncbi:MAG: hypothetical protein AAGF23_21065, partial [Acidobacteriota bacterium]
PGGVWEIRSRILEVAAPAAVPAGDGGGAGELLLDAQHLLEREGRARHSGAQSRAARLAEIRLAQARVLVRERRPYPALGLLQLALDVLPAGRDLRLKLEIQHELIGLHVSRGDAAAADALLVDAGALYGHAVSDPLLRAERDRLRGRLAFDQARFDDALTALVPSVGRLLALGRYPDALTALEELRRALPRCPDPERWRPQARRLLGQCLSRSPGIEAAGAIYLQTLAKLARDLGVEFDLGEFIGTRRTAERVH